MNETKWTENIILADADYVDKVAFDLIVNFERMIGRRIPQADMARWLECIALDGGLREKQSGKGTADGDGQETHVILVHHHKKQQMENFVPGDYKNGLNAQAFRSPLGEFTLSAISGEGMTTPEELFLDTLQLIASQKDVKRLMVIPNETIYNNVREKLNHTDPDKHITVFAMQPMTGGQFRQEILGYSLMSALGIRADEIKTE
jgi:hypothetical protein